MQKIESPLRVPSPFRQAPYQESNSSKAPSTSTKIPIVNENPENNKKKKRKRKRKEFSARADKEQTVWSLLGTPRNSIEIDDISILTSYRLIFIASVKLSVFLRFVAVPLWCCPAPSMVPLSLFDVSIHTQRSLTESLAWAQCQCQFRRFRSGVCSLRFLWPELATHTPPGTPCAS